MIPPRIFATKSEGLYFATEADLLNLALFGLTANSGARQIWKKKGNLRDHATTEHLLALANLENLNAEFIRQSLDKDQRLQRLNEIAIHQMSLLLNVPAAKFLEMSGGGVEKF